MLHNLSFSNAFLQIHVRAVVIGRESSWGGLPQGCNQPCSFAAGDYPLSPCFPDSPAHLGSVFTVAIPADSSNQSLQLRKWTNRLLWSGKSGNYSPPLMRTGILKGVGFVTGCVWGVGGGHDKYWVTVGGSFLPLLRRCWKNVALLFLKALCHAPPSVFLSKLVQERPLSFLRNALCFFYENLPSFLSSPNFSCQKMWHWLCSVTGTTTIMMTGL